MRMPTFNPIKLYRSELALYLAVLTLVAGLLQQASRDRLETETESRSRQVETLMFEARDTALRVENFFSNIYRGMRTIARLPGVRSIDRYAATFDEGARISVQELYNSLAENVAISELYIVPVDFDPDAVDPKTGKLQEPITTFDELIVGRNATPANSKATIAPTAQVEEVEIHEYREMRAQITLLKQLAPKEVDIANLDYPAIISRQVVTCDNRNYSPNDPDDAARSGLVYSVPFYSDDGRLRGMISAVFLSSVLADMLRLRGSELVSVDRDFKLTAKLPPDADEAQDAANVGFTNVHKLSIKDVGGAWRLRTSIAERTLRSSRNMSAAADLAFNRTLATIAAACSMLLLIFFSFQRQRDIEQRNQSLEVRVAARTVELEQARIDAEQANLAKTRFLANVSHELRTPLSAILGTAELMRGEVNTLPIRVETIRSSGQALLDLVNGILDLTAVESGRVSVVPTACCLKRVLTDVFELMEPQAREKGLVLSLQLAPELPERIVTDVGKLRQIVTNLLGNAVKFTDQGVVVLSCNMRGATDVKDETSKPWFVVTVRDTGRGLPDHFDLSAFEFRANMGSDSSAQHGFGLGLPISSALANVMGGHLDFRRETPGASFSVTLPATMPASQGSIQLPAPDVATAQTPRHLAGLRVLLVEDHAALAALTREMLLRLQADPTIVGTGEDALAAFSPGAFDVILMDCRLPGMDGLETTRQLRRREAAAGRRPVTILALTANAFDWDRAACVAAGMDALISKPFSASGLCAAILSARPLSREKAKAVDVVLMDGI